MNKTGTQIRVIDKKGNIRMKQFIYSTNGYFLMDEEFSQNCKK